MLPLPFSLLGAAAVAADERPLVLEHSGGARRPFSLRWSPTPTPH